MTEYQGGHVFDHNLRCTLCNVAIKDYHVSKEKCLGAAHTEYLLPTDPTNPSGLPPLHHPIYTADQLLLRAIEIKGRVVSSNDLNQWQISEARSLGNFYVSQEGYGWAALPWELTTDKDRNREKAWLGSMPRPIP